MGLTGTTDTHTHKRIAFYILIIGNKETRTNFGELQKGELHYQVGDRI